MGYLRFSDERPSWKSSHRSIASAANRSFFDVGISLSFSQAPFGQSSVTPAAVWNILAGLLGGLFPPRRANTLLQKGLTSVAVLLGSPTSRDLFEEVIRD